MHVKPSINRLGEQAILLQWDFKISPENLKFLLSIKKYIASNIVKHKVEITNTYNSILINYVISIESVYSDFERLKTLDFHNIPLEAVTSKLYRVPVCYDAEFGLDLELLAKEKSLTIDEVISLHTAPEYTLYFIGFLPGFLYLGGMHERLKMPRKSEPRASVLKGAVGIAENQTGIYPNSSPAGWQIIGNCPVALFDPKSEPPCPFASGDRIQFYSVSKLKYDEIQQEVQAGTYHLTSTHG
ncbi:5-oxoprolinase subunit PxpB [Leeuwenhoekiella palythoae]|uniref:Allophanate hydrolase subunit 1 n=1 Tax=Leeuwenhoekiella palythoae TaxID=573501 RepID=A0A1M5XH67_9FLAO|nr:5-oxoprolinase subunit PxpB [Leeuwenhoekiella palythoae]RXG30046.1 KipI family sensor histidine kinase inhibitor [Leeuwenhoekiella palythoae]SHH99177.1 Allophanate hydrolase subunit 1 [Leeuwenhoekiella palythoae]